LAINGDDTVSGFAAHAVSPAGDRGVLDGAPAMAWTVVDLATAPGAFDRIKEKWEHPPPASG
jgi:hypothetical protein